MSQMSFSDFEYAGKRKQTRRERYLAKMDQVVPWSGLLGLIEPYYPKAGHDGKSRIDTFIVLAWMGRMIGPGIRFGKGPVRDKPWPARRQAAWQSRP